MQGRHISIQAKGNKDHQYQQDIMNCEMQNFDQ